MTREERERWLLMQVDYEVWDIIRHSRSRTKPTSAEELFEQGFKSDRERIEQNTRKYAGMSVAEAFEREYGVHVSQDIRDKVDAVPMDLMLGQTLRLKIDTITNDGVIFNPGNYKATFSTRNNLSRYHKFKEFKPVSDVPVRVVEIKPDTVMVDMFGPMVDEYVVPRAKAPWIQNKIHDYQPITVKNLHLVGGGFLGRAVIPNISEWLGEEYTIDAFIPGSQIVQNTTDDFEQFEGRDVQAFIMAYSPKPPMLGGGMSLICSVKNFIKHRGHIRMMTMHKWWCDNGEEWDDFSSIPHEGVVTGILNSSQKCGVFVEIPELEMTGMINVPASRLSEYHPGDLLNVTVSGFDEKLVYNEAVGQMQHLPQFEIVDGAIKSVNIKPILKEV
jgi:ribosomal protein S1